MYTTEAAPIGLPIPRQTRRMTSTQIIDYMRDHFKSEFVFDNQGRLKGEKPLNKSTAFLMACGSALMDPDDYRNAFRANFPECGDEWAKAVVVWYHAATPHQTFIGVVSTGYNAW